MDKRRGEDDRDVYWSVSDQRQFNSDKLVRGDARGDQDHPSIALDAARTAWIVWENHNAEKPQVWLRTSRQEDDSRCLSSASEAAAHPSIACQAGIVAIAYQTGSGRQSNVVVHVIKNR